MSRISRKNLPGTFHHVMSQGINKEYIFNDGYLKEKYKKIINCKKQNSNVNIIAYCIMDNHVHFLLNVEKNEDMSKFMQQVNTSYARFYNKSKNRVGYVFRDRYLSKIIFDELQLRRCISYIHKNPVVAGLVETESKYKFSSYNEYLNIMNDDNLICENASAMVFGTNQISRFIDEYHEIHNYKNKELIEFDNFEKTLNANIEDLMNKYRDLSVDEKIRKMSLEEKISERNLAEYFNKTRHQIRKILNKNHVEN